MARSGPFPMCRHVKSHQPSPELSHAPANFLLKTLFTCSAPSKTGPSPPKDVVSEFLQCLPFPSQTDPEQTLLFFFPLSKRCTHSSGICCSPATCAPSIAAPRALPNAPRRREQFLWAWNCQTNPQSLSLAVCGTTLTLHEGLAGPLGMCHPSSPKTSLSAIGA